MSERAGRVGGGLEQLAGVVGLALVGQDAGEEIGDIRRGAAAGHRGAELLLGLVEPAGAVECPAERGQDLGGAWKLQGIDVGELQAARLLGRVVLLDQGERQQVGDGGISGSVAVQRLEDRFGGGQVPQVPGDERLDLLAPPSSAGSSFSASSISRACVGGPSLVQEPCRVGEPDPRAFRLDLPRIIEPFLGLLEIAFLAVRAGPWRPRPARAPARP